MKKVKTNIIYRILIFLISILIIVPILLYFIIQTTTVQNYLTKKVATYFSNKFDTEVTVGSVDFKFFNALVLNNFYVEDQNEDTLIYISTLQLNVSKLNLSENEFKLSRIYIDSLKCFLKSDTLGNSNYDFIAEAFENENETEDTSSSDIYLELKKLEITNSKFYYKVEKDDYQSTGVDFDDFYLKDFNLDAENFVLEDDSMGLFIKDLNLIEKSGFALNSFSTGFISSSQEISTKFLYFETDNSEFVSEEIKFNFDSYDDFDDIYNNVNVNIIIEPDTKLNSEDIAFFVPELSEINEIIKFSGSLYGTLSDLTAENLDIKYGFNSHLHTNFQITGLPDISKTNFDIVIDTLHTSVKDINSLKNSETNQPFFQLPSMLTSLGSIKYRANISGILENFTVSGNLTTDIGNINTDVVVINKENISVEGLVEAVNLNLGVLLDKSEQLGTITFKSNINFTLKPDNNFEGQTVTSITHLLANNYNYQNILIDGEFSTKAFGGSININDPNLKTQFLGYIDFEKEKPIFDFNLDILRANLFYLNIEKEDSASYLSTQINAEFIGTTLDDLNGEIKFSRPLRYQKNLELYEIKEFNVKSYVTEYVAGREKKSIFITSDYFNGKIDGIFEFSTLLESLQNLATDYIPSISKNKKETAIVIDPLLYTIGSNFNFDFNILESNDLTDIFMPGVKIADSTKISGKYRDNPLSKYLKLNIITKFVEIGDTKLENINVLINTNNDKSLTTNIFCNNIYISEKIQIDTLSVETSARNDSLNLQLKWNNNSVKLNKGTISSVSVFSRDTSNKFTLIKNEFLKDTFYLNNSEWIINAFSSNVDDAGFKINNFDVINWKESERIGVSGRISKNPDDEIHVNLLNFDLSSLNDLLDNLKLEGRVLSEIKIKDIMGVPIFNSYNTIQGFKINDVKLGRLIATSDWVADSSKIKIRVFTERFTNEELVNINADSINIVNQNNTNKVEDSIKFINIVGDYFVKDKSLDFKIDFYRLKLNTFKPYLESTIDGISSSSVLFGNIKLTGSTEQPKIDGDLILKGVAFRVKFTDVFYTVSKDMNIHFDNKKIVIDETKINLSDDAGFANLSGTIYHNMFSDIFLNLNISTKNFLFLDTEETDTSSFYGKVYATGDINLAGRPDKLSLTAQIKTEKDTKIFFKLNSEQKVDVNNSFLTFVQTDDTTFVEEDDETTDYYGFSVDVNLNISPETKLQIILDEATGDIINVQGAGNLGIKMNTLGDLNLIGTLTLEKGDYMFTMKNIIKKSFTIQKGGTLTWNGDPANAVLDISALYRKDGVDLYDLVLEDDFRDVKVPVECYLNISEELTAPTISFDLQVPKANERIVSQLNNLDDENLNKQVISLLILGRFQPLPGLTQDQDPTDAAGVINTGEVLTNQLNHWLSQISNDFDLGVNYKEGDAMTSDEVGMAISTQLWDDRITINGNVDVGGDAKAADATSSIVGDFDAEVKLNKKGNLKFKVFNNSNDDNVYEKEKGLYTQGIGVFYKKEFDKWFNNKNTTVLDTTSKK